MARTILQTQKQLRDFIEMYHAADRLLNPTEDPFESSEDWTGCYFGLMSYPFDKDLHLTYGMIYDSLQGIWDYMYRQGRFFGAIIEVNDDSGGWLGLENLVRVGHRPGDPHL
jgi:hypothetical protein